LERLTQCYLQNGETLRKYASRFISAYIDVFPDSTSKELVTAFIKKLPFRLSQNIDNLTFSSIEEAIKAIQDRSMRSNKEDYSKKNLRRNE